MSKKKPTPVQGAGLLAAIELQFDLKLINLIGECIDFKILFHHLIHEGAFPLLI
jgi:hypothetical protein